jgi:uncharacterized alkaline shock family protein YloU
MEINAKTIQLMNNIVVAPINVDVVGVVFISKKKKKKKNALIVPCCTLR